MLGGHLLSSRLPLRFVAGSWCLMAVVLVYAYTGTLISYISLSKYESVINTFEDLAASKTLRIITQRGSLSAEIILVRKKIEGKFY
jgi:Ligand-gated ion channel